MDMGGHDMGNMAHSPMRYTHMTFFWGKNSAILFTGWPGARGGMYALALVVVFIFAALVEYLGCCRLETMFSPHRYVAARLARTAVHAVRVLVAYLVMLALMSFNVGVLIVAIIGHAVGFLVFRTNVCCRKSQVDGCKEDHVPMAC